MDRFGRGPNGQREGPRLLRARPRSIVQSGHEFQIQPIADCLPPASPCAGPRPISQLCRPVLDRLLHVVVPTTNCTTTMFIHPYVYSVISPVRMPFSLYQPRYSPTSRKFQPIVACRDSLMLHCKRPACIFLSPPS